MGVNSRLRDIRPPLPAPTESNDEEGGTTSGFETDVATNITTQTDKTSYEIPEDGKPIKIHTDKAKGGGRGTAQSQTSLLIEYFEASTGENSKPAVRVKVTPSSRKRASTDSPDAIRITSIGKDRKASYSRRISLGNSRNAELGVPSATEVSHSSDSTLSARPLEVEVLDPNASELSTQSRGLMYGPNESTVSSMPADSMLDGSTITESERGFDDVTAKEGVYLSAPAGSRDRTASHERLAQKSWRRLARVQGQSRQFEDSTVSGAESSLLSSNTGAKSYRSSGDVSNNPRLLGMVEDAIRKIILPEINAIREDQTQDRNVNTYDGAQKPSIMEDMYARKGLTRSLSKSSSSPNMSSKPKIFLNKDGEDPGTVLSRGDSERKKTRKSSRGSYSEERPSSSRRSSGGRPSSRGHGDSDTIRAKSSKSSSRLRETAGGAVAGALLTGAALKALDRDDSPDQRKRRSKSRGSRRSGSTGQDTLKEDVPAMPMASRINDSELTRASLVSDATETPQRQAPVREVSRGSLRDAMSPVSTGTPPRTPGSRGLSMNNTNDSIESPRSPYGGAKSTKDRLAALAAAGVGGAAVAKGVETMQDRHVDADGYGSSSPITFRKTSSPAQSVSSLKKTFEEPEARSRSAASKSSAAQEKGASRTSLRSDTASPNTKLARSRQQSSRSIGGDEYGTEYATPLESFDRGGTPGTPTYGESVDDWWERQHRVNDELRSSLDDDGNKRDSYIKSSNRDSYQTNPYPQDEKRFTWISSEGEDRGVDSLDGEQGVRGVGAIPRYINSPYRAESAVASLVLEPSNVSSGKSGFSAQESPAAKANASFSARLRDLNKDSPPLYQGSTLSQTMPSQDRWQALKGRARDISGSRDHLPESPQQTSMKSLREQPSVDSQPVMGASGLPLADDPLPEAEYYDDTKSISTVASVVKEPLGGDITGKDSWPYTPDPDVQNQRGVGGSVGPSSNAGLGKGAAGMMAAAAAGAGALAGANALRQPTIEDENEDRLTPDLGRQRGQYYDREATPTSPAMSRDEGYVTGGGRSAGALTPDGHQTRYSKRDVDEYNRAMNAYGGEQDPFVGSSDPHSRNISGNSHGMDSPVFDASTGRGIAGIESKDIVALMDHLTVRDAQRNARDTEILVSLVRSTTEMRQNFDEMKRFIVEQDRMIMQSTDRSVDQTVQKALGGPRPLPTGSPRTPRGQSQEDIQTKRKGVLRRALKGLTGSKSASDLAKVEGMLMQILDNVEDLKQQGGGTQREAFSSPYTNNSLDTYERLRNVPDSGYEPEGQAGTSSTASQSGPLSITPRQEKQQFHSGYDGRRGSANRVSTVVEDDEDDYALEPHETRVLEHQFENNEGFLTPTQERQNARGFTSPNDTPPAVAFNGMPAEEVTPRSTERQRKHRSNGSSVFGVPKISRWSKTTSSSTAVDPATLDSPNLRNQRPLSEASRSGSSTNQYDEEPYELEDDDRLRSTQSLAREKNMGQTRSIRSQASKLTRTPSPLIPSEVSEASYNQRDGYGEPSPVQEDFDDDEMDDPKYQAHRNSLLLEHPQPRQGTTGRHQNTLETQAHSYEGPTGTDSDLSQRSVSDFDPATWGSSGTAGLAKHRLSQLNEPMSPTSMSSSGGYQGARYANDNDSLIPQKPAVPPKIRQQEPEYDPEPEWEPTYSNSGFGRGNYYSSPYGSGHLLEPIAEVESIIDVDRQSQLSRQSQASPEPTVSNAQAVDMRTTARKITGPRPMGSRSSSATQPKLVETMGTVRRKPVRGGDYE